MSIVPLDKLEELRREQRGEQQEERPALHAPEPTPLEMISGSIEPDVDEDRGVTIIDFTI